MLQQCFLVLQAMISYEVLPNKTKQTSWGKAVLNSGQTLTCLNKIIFLFYYLWLMNLVVLVGLLSYDIEAIELAKLETIFGVRFLQKLTNKLGLSWPKVSSKWSLHLIQFWFALTLSDETFEKYR